MRNMQKRVSAAGGGSAKLKDMTDNTKTIRLTIDSRTVEVGRGATILYAARAAGISIPTMCHKDGYKPSTSCMVCVVRVEGNPSFVPSCGAAVQDGMRVWTNTPDVLEARKTAVELLLSEHAGDCEGPCRIGCPANMNIPLMLRQITAGRLDLAIGTIKADIALPAVLGRICPAPCEKVCRRNAHDAAVSICQLKRFVADWDLRRFDTYRPQCEPAGGKKVAVVGAGPCGLAAAYYLARSGVRCVLFDKNEKAGGALRTGIEESVLPRDILDMEIHQILSLGNIEFHGGMEVGLELFDSLCKDYDAVFIASGENSADKYGLKKTAKGLKADLATYQTDRANVFAGGGVIGRRRICVRAVADGKEAAVSILQYLRGQNIAGPEKRFNSHLGQLMEGEMEQFLTGAEKGPRCPARKEGFLTLEAMTEAQRCLHCDCGKADDCTLRKMAELNYARQQTYKGQRKPFSRQAGNSGLVFEAGKCILCGLCVQAARAYTESTGLTFSARGFETRVAVPLQKALNEALTKEAMEKCVAVCPTGAMTKI
ncbi:MAG: FAD-binding protein [Planctomycetes bacterium]|nr:FAD-binding protein [Planctomycetota bacterium]